MGTFDSRLESTSVLTRRLAAAPMLVVVFTLAAMFLTVMTPSAQASGPSTLAAGQSLSGGQMLTSPNGSYRAVMQGDGNFVVYQGSRALWSSKTNGSGADRVAMQGDGNVVVYAGSSAKWASGTVRSGGSALVMQDDGNLVLYATGSRAIWSSKGGYVGDILGAGKLLTRNTQIRSKDGAYRALMQSDGNFVLYKSGTALWNTQTANSGGDRVVLQGDGNLVLYAGSTAKWNSNTVGKGGTRLIMQNDGNLVLYTSAGKAVWNSNTAGGGGGGGGDYPDGDAVCRETGSAGGLCASSTWVKNGSTTSSRGYVYRNCTDFAAWKANSLAGRTVVPAGWGNATSWDEKARSAGYRVDGSPRVGDIAQQDGGYGHVAIVAEVGSGSVRLAEYNHIVTTSSGATSYDGKYYSNRWVSTSSYEYIHWK